MMAAANYIILRSVDGVTSLTGWGSLFLFLAASMASASIYGSRK